MAEAAMTYERYGERLPDFHAWAGKVEQKDAFTSRAPAAPPSLGLYDALAWRPYGARTVRSGGDIISIYSHQR